MLNRAARVSYEARAALFILSLKEILKRSMIVNISAFHLGRRERGGEAMTVIQIDAALDEQTLGQVRAFEPVISARQIKL